MKKPQTPKAKPLNKPKLTPNNFDKMSEAQRLELRRQAQQEQAQIDEQEQEQQPEN